MKTKGTIFKRKINNKEYYYHKYLENGKQVNKIMSDNEAYSLSFKLNFEGDYDEFINHKFNLEVSFGENLYRLSKVYKEFNKRYCYSQIEQFIQASPVGKVLILYGLRRTGKTTLMFQTINDLSFNNFCKAVYIKCDEGKTVYQLLDDLSYLSKNGFYYFFIDEITLLEDFITLSSTISDIYGLKGKIVLSGTDSLGFSIASHHELYDRNIMIHTTYISFKEFAEVLGIRSIDRYIEFGGTMSIEGVDYNKVINKGSYISNEYVDSAIIHNIIHSLESVKDGKLFFSLFDLYEKKELENVIARLIEDTNHKFAISVIEREFKSRDYGSLKQLLSLPNNYAKFGNVLSGVDEKQLTNDLMSALNILNKEKQTHKIDENVLKEIEYFLSELDVLAFVDEISYPTFSTYKRPIFTQPGLRYSQAKTLVELLMNDRHLKKYDITILKAIKEKLLSDVKGRMIEDIIIYETSINISQVFKMYFANKGEYDMVVLNDEELVSYVYEIKHASTFNRDQTKHLINKELKTIFEKKFYPIESSNVLYKGENIQVDDITYINIEDYLLKN